MNDVAYLQEAVTRELAMFLMEDRGMSLRDALEAVRGSRTFAQLMSEGTGLYRESPAYVYEYLKEELGTS